MRSFQKCLPIKKLGLEASVKLNYTIFPFGMIVVRRIRLLYVRIIMAALRSRRGHYIFALWFLLLLPIYLFFLA